MTTDKWKERFMILAQNVSGWSKDPSHQIGAVIVNDDNTILSTGYNGFAKNVLDSGQRIQNKELKRLLTLHAEENAILHAKRELTGCSIYIYGLPPCVHCASLLIQSGIKAVYYRMPENTQISIHWKDNLDLAEEILLEVGVSITKI